MNFFEKHDFPHSNSLIVECKEQIEGKFSLLIRTQENALIGAGIYDPNIDKESYGFYGGYPLDELNYFEELRKNNGFLFLIADNHFYSTSINLVRWVSIKKTSISELQEEINKVFESQKRENDGQQEYIKHKEVKLDEENPLLSHLLKVIDRLERILITTENKGWNYLEIKKEEIERDIKTLNEWKLSSIDAHRAIILKNLCYKYDCKWIE